MPRRCPFCSRTLFTINAKLPPHRCPPPPRKGSQRLTGPTDPWCRGSDKYQRHTK